MPETEVGGFNRPSQHPDEEGVPGQTGRMVEGADRSIGLTEPSGRYLSFRAVVDPVRVEDFCGVLSMENAAWARRFHVCRRRRAWWFPLAERSLCRLHAPAEGKGRK